jgi:putative ABC transport system ATP-binding protein
MRGPVLSLRGVEKGYEEGGRRHVVLSGVDADIGGGELVALLGPSGSGKSTLLNLIAGLDRPDGGTILLDGVDVTALDERARTLLRRRTIGFIFQFFNLIPTLTVAENVRLPLELQGAPDAARRALDALDGVGLAHRGVAYPDRLSGGEQQRVAIARALVHRPSLVLADEPTGNLDAETGGRVLSLLASRVRERGVTMLLVTHSAGAAGLADRVLALRAGRLVAPPSGGGAAP